MKNKKFDIFKTFEIFNTESLSLIRQRIIKFVLVETENFFANNSTLMTESMNDNSLQFTIINNKKVYNLLSNSWRKYQKRLENENINC